MKLNPVEAKEEIGMHDEERRKQTFVDWPYDGVGEDCLCTSEKVRI